MIAAAPAADADTPLPRLRRDLGIDLVAVDREGFPAAVITDPLRGCYFKLAWPESGVFLQWPHVTTPSDLMAALQQTYGLAVSDGDIEGVVAFGHDNQLTEFDHAGTWHRFAAMRHARRQSLIAALFHQYLFFRVPLVRPEPWLKPMQRPLSFLYARWFWSTLALLAMVGLHLALRQWSAVVAAVVDALRLETVAVYAVALLVLKIMHELGHALTTVRQGCRVPSMGIAFMLGAPVFYTDTSDSWRLQRRNQRLAIVFAGVAAELIVAVAAILLWSFLPDGLMRQICFAFATVSITLSLVVNLNPFMRFDGYFALSDYLDVPNLQARAFDLGVWRLREILFDLGHPPPEHLSPRLERTLIHYASATTIYRFFLFIGIAAMIYVVAGKAVGIVLGVLEIGFFIALPITREVTAWWSLRGEIVRRRRLRCTGMALAAALLALFVPWLATVEVQAVLAAEREEAIYVPFPARLIGVQVAEGQIVRTGDVLFIAEAPDLSRDLERTALELRALTIQAGRLAASDKEREQRFVIESRLARATEKIDAVRRQLRELVVTAPFEGRVVDVDPGLRLGQWVGVKQPLGRIISEGRSRARGMIAEIDVGRVRIGARAVFVPDDPSQSRQLLVVASIADASDGRFAEPALADRHGGLIPAGEMRGELVARQGVFEVGFAEFERTTGQVMRGTARVDAGLVSPATLLWRRTARVFVREQGF